jgi:hypothetical protein
LDVVAPGGIMLDRNFAGQSEIQEAACSRARWFERDPASLARVILTSTTRHD